jgi:hypothetical protein
MDLLRAATDGLGVEDPRTDESDVGAEGRRREGVLGDDLGVHGGGERALERRVDLDVEAPVTVGLLGW